MKKFFADRPMLGFFIVAVAAAVVSTWILCHAIRLVSGQTTLRQCNLPPRLAPFRV